VRGTRQPRSRGARDRAVGEREGLLRRLRSGGERGAEHGGDGGGHARGISAGSAGADEEPQSRGDVGSGGGLRDDEPQRPRVHEPLPFGQAGRVQGPRVLRGGRHRHGPLLGSARDRRRRQDRLPAGARVGRAHHGHLVLSDRDREDEAAPLHRRLPVGERGEGVGPRDRVRTAGEARRGVRDVARPDRADAGEPAGDDEAPGEPDRRLGRAGSHPDPGNGVRRNQPPHRGRLRLPEKIDGGGLQAGRAGARRALRRLRALHVQGKALSFTTPRGPRGRGERSTRPRRPSRPRGTGGHPART
jgi:hypothetical protein